MSRLVNAQSVQPDDIEAGDVMCFVVKALVTRKDADGTVHYRIYRCDWPGSLGDVPQGSRLADEGIICGQVFPILRCEGIPDSL